MNETKLYEMTVPGSREKFAEWIEKRGGIAVWPCVNLSNMTGPCFTPALSESGEPTPKPGWQYGARVEVVTDLARFKFAKSMKEVDRFRVALRRSGNGLMVKLTDASSAKLRKRLDKAGEDARYHFDYETQEAVITVPEW